MYWRHGENVADGHNCERGSAGSPSSGHDLVM